MCRAQIGLRRDVTGARALHLDLPEAPHRGYDSAAELFAGMRADDEVWRELAALLLDLHADVLLGPQGLGGHVDHLHVLRVVAGLGRPVLYWRDAPYVLRDPAARPGAELPHGLLPVVLPQDRQRRADACACYTTQLGFQFGGADAMRAALARCEELSDLGRARVAELSWERSARETAAVYREAAA